MISMAGRTVAESITTTAATQEARIGAATNPISEAITEATTEVAIEAPFAAVDVVDGMITTVEIMTRTGVNHNDTGRVARTARHTFDSREAATAHDLTKSHHHHRCEPLPSTEHQTYRRTGRLARQRLERTSSGVISAPIHPRTTRRLQDRYTLRGHQSPRPHHLIQRSVYYILFRRKIQTHQHLYPLSSTLLQRPPCLFQELAWNLSTSLLST